MAKLRRPFRLSARSTPRDLPGITSLAERAGGNSGERFLLFDVGGERYAIPAAFLREVAFVDGVDLVGGSEPRECVIFPHRGDPIPALDLPVLFDYPPGLRRAGGASVLVSECGGERLGLVVDRVGDVVDVGPQAIIPIPEGASQLPAGCFRGVMRCGDRMVLVLEAAGLAGLECVRQFGKALVSPAAGSSVTQP